jgi:hypothetical protein
MSDDSDNPHKAEAKPPKSRGGGRSTHPRQLHENSLKNLKRQWKKGESGNPLGLPKSVIEIARLARERSTMAIERLTDIMMNDKAPYRDQIQAATVLLDRGCGRPPLGVYHAAGTGSNYEAGDVNAIDGNPPGVLVKLARERRDSAYKAELQAELRRIEAMEAKEREERADQVEAARAAMANGEEVSPLMKMLVKVREATD